jgi:hypothetical protein
MDGIVEAKVKGYLRNHLNVPAYNCGAIVTKIRALAKVSGHAMDDRFAGSGLGSGPEGRVASAIVERALGGGGSATAEKDIRIALERWVRKSPPRGM